MLLTITDEKSKKASAGAPRPVIPSSLRSSNQIYQKRVILVDEYIPQFWNIDERCWTGDNCSRGAVGKKVESVWSCPTHFSVGHPTIAFLQGNRKKVQNVRHLHSDAVVVVHAPKHLTKIVRVDLI